MADQGGGGNISPSTIMKEYRKGNWTVSETMILIEAKKMDDERRMKRSSGLLIGESSTTTSHDHHRGGGGLMINSNSNNYKPTELRWKWVEDYCWRKGCIRSQNQCNDKWDNLMRDYKKVRDYERRILLANNDNNKSSSEELLLSSYWKMEKNERKERNLPTNMFPQIYQALVEVVERKGATTGGGGGIGECQRLAVAESGTISTLRHHQAGVVASNLPSSLLHQFSSPIISLPPPPPPPQAVLSLPSPPSQPLPPPDPYLQPLPSVDSDTSEHSDSPAKRRRRSSAMGEEAGTRGGSGGVLPMNYNTSINNNNNEAIGSAISKSAITIAEALQACEEREERRHKEIVNLHEKRLELEEAKSEINRQGINGLVDAINNLATSIHALASHKNKNKNKNKNQSLSSSSSSPK